MAARKKKQVTNKKEELPLLEVKTVEEIDEKKVVESPTNIPSADESAIFFLQSKLAVADEFLEFDFTKTKMNFEEFKSLHDVLKTSGFDKKVEDMFTGGKINFTENRSVLHVALRDQKVISAFGESEMPGNRMNAIHAELEKIKNFSDELHDGKLLGITGKIIDTVVNIGIGGSDLGPRVVCEALSQFASKIKVHFVANVDPSEMKDVMTRIDPEKTIFVVVSKTFTTQETLANARLALQILEKRILNRTKEDSLNLADLSRLHFVAVSAANEEVHKFGIQRIFQMWDYVGGRFSLWSAAGLSISLYLGFTNFLRLLSGASIADRTFRTNPLSSPATVHALIEIWHNNNGYPTKCIVPYDFYLRNFYTHLQQLEMESNGKWSDKHKTCMIIWGGVGTNSQHSFFQLLHQGTQKILTEFLLPITSNEECSVEGIPSLHSAVVANCIAQSEALFVGLKSDDVAKNFPGERPSITICYSRLTPEILGAMIAHYEHKVFVQGHFWGINSFDQFGVQLGKMIANTILESINNEDVVLEGYTESTKNLIRMVIDAKKENKA